MRMQAGADLGGLGPILGVIFLVVLVADLAILFRWMRWRAQARAAHLPGYPPTPEDLGEEPSAPSLSYPSRQDPFPPEGTRPIVSSLPSLPPRPFARVWSLIDPFLGIQLILVVSSVLVAIPVVFIALANFRPDMDPSALTGSPAMKAAISKASIFGLFLQNSLFVVFVAWCMRRYGLTMQQIGFRWPKPREIALGLGLGLLVFAVAQGASLGLGYLLEHLLPREALANLKKMSDAFNAAEMFKQLQGTGWKILFVLGGALAAPIGEEVFFRGLVYNGLKRRLNVGKAIVLSGLAFAMVHVSPVALLLIFPMGMLLAYVYERTRSLSVTILMHIVNNGLAFLILWFFPHWNV